MPGFLRITETPTLSMRSIAPEPSKITVPLAASVSVSIIFIVALVGGGHIPANTSGLKVMSENAGAAYPP